MDWQDKLDEVARDVSKVREPALRDAILGLVAVVDEVALEVLGREPDEGVGAA